MKPRHLLILAVSTVLSALICPAATLIVDDYGARVVTQAPSTPGASFELVDFDLSPDVHTPFFRPSGFDLQDTRVGSPAEPWLKAGFITLDSADFLADSPLANAEITTAASPDASTCLRCEPTAEPESTPAAPQHPRVIYTLVMTSFPREAEGIYTNAIYFNRKEAHQPYAILMLREGLAAVEPLALHR